MPMPTSIADLVPEKAIQRARALGAEWAKAHPDSDGPGMQDVPGGAIEIIATETGGSMNALVIQTLSHEFIGAATAALAPPEITISTEESDHG